MSLGIWLASVYPDYLEVKCLSLLCKLMQLFFQSEKWSCSENVHNFESINRCQLSAEEIVAIHEQDRHKK